MNVVHLVSNPVWGGGERYVLDLARAQRADGHNVCVLTRRKPAVASRFADEGLLGGNLRLGGVWDVVSPVRLARRLDRLAAGGALTVVHVHNFKDAYTALAARRLARDPSAVRVVCTRHLVKAARTSASALRTLRGLDAIIFVSRVARDAFLSSGPDIDRSRLHVVHNAITVPPAPGNGPRPADGPVRLIFAGRITPEKGLDVLVRALAEIRDLDWRLEVCGTGASRDVMPVVRLARGLDVDSRIDWRGFVPDVLARMAAADVAVAPSVARESFGLVLLEAFSQGLPVVTTDNGAQPELMTDGVEGLLVPPSDHIALARALRKIISDSDTRRRMAAEAAGAYASRFCFDTFYRRINDVYTSIR